MSDLSPMARSYLVTMLWSSLDESDESGGEPLDAHYGIEDVDTEAVAAAAADCSAFLEKCYAAGLDFDGNDAERVGHDLWLTRNRHGAGFWDGDYPTDGDALTEIANAMGERAPYVGDDGKIYVFGG